MAHENRTQPEWMGIELTTKVGKDTPKPTILLFFFPEVWIRETHTNKYYCRRKTKGPHLPLEDVRREVRRNVSEARSIFSSILAKPWRSGGQEEEAQPDPPAAEAVEEENQIPNTVADEIIASARELEELAEGLNLMRTGSNGEDLMLSDFEQQTGKEE
ncbi:unnamed protein product [Ceratitis capitata]|uniref:(Mediterranean fruit fly) hypothetical protein n=1 Tax=Ceratitis capitata TaxID=7213 RepID=A0A811U276_CERCA|nr:unnamed protein product [Ceratitis capitata]